MEITTEMVKSLREKTGAGMMDCKKALLESTGDTEKAIEFLRKKGLATAAKKAGRATAEGLVTSYIHAGGKIGVLLEVNCEADFVAKTEEFKTFVKDISMHVAASSPQYVKREDVPAETVEKERRLYREQAQELKKPPQVIEKIVDGKIDRFYSEICLLEQPFVKDPEKTVKEVFTELITKMGENMGIRRFVRFQLGEVLDK